MAMPKFLFDNRLADVLPVASTTATGNYAAANLNDMRPYTWWKPTALPATVTVDCGSAKAANYALVYGHDLFTQGAVFEVRGSTDNFASSNVLVATVTPANNNPVILEFASVSYRYWRIRITGTTMPSIAIALIGTAFAMPQYLNEGFDPIGRTAIQQANNNENGQSLGKIIDFELWKQTLEFNYLSWAWLRSTWEPAWKSNLRGYPVVFAWDTGNYPAELQLAVCGDTYKTPHKTGSLANLIFDLSGVAA